MRLARRTPLAEAPRAPVSMHRLPQVGIRLRRVGQGSARRLELARRVDRQTAQLGEHEEFERLEQVLLGVAPGTVVETPQRGTEMIRRERRQQRAREEVSR